MNNNPQPFDNIQPPPSGGRLSCANSLVSRVIIALILGFVTLMTVISVAWLVMNPHEPFFRVNSLSVSNFTASDSRPTGNYSLGLTIKNPNKKTEVFLDDFNIWVSYETVILSEAAVKSVYLEKMIEKNLKVDQFVVKKSSSKLHGDLGNHWSKGPGRGTLKFNVNMQVRTSFEAGNWPTEKKVLRVFCMDLDVFFSDKIKGTGKLRKRKGFEKKDYQVHSTSTQ